MQAQQQPTNEALKLVYVTERLHSAEAISIHLIADTNRDGGAIVIADMEDALRNVTASEDVFYGVKDVGYFPRIVDVVEYFALTIPGLNQRVSSFGTFAYPIFHVETTIWIA